MSDHSNDEKRKNIPDRNIQRMSKPNDESMGKEDRIHQRKSSCRRK